METHEYEMTLLLEILETYDINKPENASSIAKHIHHLQEYSELPYRKNALVKFEFRDFDASNLRAVPMLRDSVAQLFLTIALDEGIYVSQPKEPKS